MDIEVNAPYFDEFLRYYEKAHKLQLRNIHGVDVAEHEIDDPLMWNVSIYDTISRRYAGFSNVLECLWHADDMPKGHDHARPEYRGLKTKWSDETWAYVFLVHRITGSGASFMADHGYRNTILFELTKFDEIGQMVEFIRTFDRPMFTSLGNQIPPFNKPEHPYQTGGKMYLCEMAPKLAKAFVEHAKNERMGIRDGVDFACEFHSKNGWKKFHFVLTAWIMDFAEYFPQLVDPKSSIYVGKNALETISLIYKPKPRKMNILDFQEEAMRYTCELVDWRSMPYDMEDVYCDFIRYIENFIPGKDYDHLELFGSGACMNNASITHHKGRQWNADRTDVVWLGDPDARPKKRVDQIFVDP